MEDVVPKEDAVPVEGVNHPSGGGLPAGPDTDVRVRDITLRAGGASLQIEEVPMMPIVKSQSLTISGEKWVQIQEPPSEEVGDFPCLENQLAHFLRNDEFQGEEGWPAGREGRDWWEERTPNVRQVLS